MLKRTKAEKVGINVKKIANALKKFIKVDIKDNYVPYVVQWNTYVIGTMRSYF